MYAITEGADQTKTKAILTNMKLYISYAYIS